MTTDQILKAFKLYSAVPNGRREPRKRKLFGQWFMDRYFPNQSDPWIAGVRTSNEALVRLLFSKRYNHES